MLHPDYRGARGSNAGDDFHELWALRQALALLEQDTPLTAIAVEGLRAEDEHGVPVDVWDGVDCTLYFGGDRASTAREIIIQQFKYSAADPTRYWTVSRLTAASNRKGDNSVIARLGKAFTQLAKLRPDLASAGALRVRLVSNQQVDSAAADALSGNVADPQRAEMRRQALVASGLSEEDFAVFARALDLSECGSGSRFDVEDRVLFTLSTLRDEDARTALDNLMRFVRRMMLPEAKEELITRERILARLGFSDPGALFPCPAAVRKVDAPIVRSTARAIAARLATGEQYLCLYGEGGCGKTTVLQELESLLPPASIIVVFDCFGGGRYLDSDAYRHRPKDAFLQLSNDLARHLRTPYLVTRSPEVDYPRVFKKRLEAAAAVTSSRADDALLVVAIDAADNSVTAAASCSPPERSFIHDFTGLGELPRNVRLVVSARSGRLALLELPRRFTAIEMGGFTREETAAFVRKRWPEAPDTWLDDFQYLSRGNPRVEAYALDYAEKIPADALAYLRPSGKSLDAIFHEQFEFAIKKGASEKQVKVFCAGLVGLPRPVPVEDLAAVTDLGGPFVLDLCADLAPGVRSEEGLISFADEDFEHFVRVAAGAELGPIQQRIADRFNQRHRTDPYSARHVAAALLAAGRGREVLSLLETDRIPVAIADPVVRRETQLQRFRIAMKVCREAGNVVDAVLTVLAGAEALRTDAAIRRTLIENPDLAAAFARDSLAQTILRDARSIESHGPVLFHLMAVDARRGEPILVRETHRQLRAWLQRRNADDEQPPARSKWPIDVRDIAAETEALLRIGGPERAVTGLRKWRPRSVALQVGSDLTRKLIITGDSQLVSACIEEAAVQSPWDLLLLTPLALATRQTDVPRLERSLARLLRRGLIRLDLLDSELRESNPTTAFLETILIACEVAIAHGGNAEHVRPVLERFASEDARRLDRVSASRAATLDLTLRAHSLLERMTGRKLTMASYLLEASPPPQGPREEDSRHRQQEASERRREIEELLGPLLDLYDARAQALLRVVPPTNVETLLRGSVERISREDYRFSRSPSGYNVRARAALSIARLMAIPGLDRAMLLDNAMSALGSRSEWLGPAELAVLSELALDRGTHERILAIATRSANAIRSARASAEDKCHALVRLSRLLADISRDDATVVFRHAIEAASEIDQGAVHEIALFAPLANRAVAVMDPVQRRATALSFGLVVEDTSIRLSGVEHFPWRQVTDALATLDMSHALAAVARWEDADLADRHDTLPRVIVTGASRRDLPASHAAALLCLLERADEEVFERITFAANTVESSLLSGLVEELAYDELLRFGRGTRAGVTAALQALMGATPEGKWLRQLAEATAFHHAAKSSGESRGIQPQLAAENERQNLVPIQRVGRFTSGPEINRRRRQRGRHLAPLRHSCRCRRSCDR